MTEKELLLAYKINPTIVYCVMYKKFSERDEEHKNICKNCYPKYLGIPYEKRYKVWLKIWKKKCPKENI